jgi:paraquat-inducible protein A
LHGWIALFLSAIFIFAIANLFPIATLSIQGISIQATLPGALWLTWQQGHRTLAVMTGMFAFWLPLTQLLFSFWALMAIRSGRLPWDFRYGMRLLYLVGPWSMVPVLMLGILVALVKFAGLATVIPGPGIWAFGCLTFLLTGLSRLTPQRLWHFAEDAGLVDLPSPDVVQDPERGTCSSCGFVQHLKLEPQPCERCGARVHFRKPDIQTRVWALVVAASIVYIPANVLPVMEISTATGSSAHTILGGVLELWRLGSWDLAVIVFVASVVVPLTKLLALGVLLAGRRWRGWTVQRQRTRLYELVEFIGQWSMLDVFVVILMTAMANFPGVSQVIAGPGAASFGMVVILTMLAALSYDPRRGWDSEPRERDGTIQSSARNSSEANTVM